jgi:hypothetical protein
MGDTSETIELTDAFEQWLLLQIESDDRQMKYNIRKHGESAGELLNHAVRNRQREIAHVLSKYRQFKATGSCEYLPPGKRAPYQGSPVSRFVDERQRWTR